MAWTSVGFDGTITEIQWAGLSSLLGNGYVAAGNGDCLVTAVGGARQVSVAAGSLYGDGVLSTNSGAETVALTTPTNGQWYVVALRRTWATNTAALVAIAGATTTTTTPTAPPTSFPTLNTDPGVLTDQPIAWAWCNSANTTVVVYDIRLKAVKSLPPVVATSAERDAKFMSPTQGLQVWRDDLGAVETYYGLYNASTNPGGRDTAGWTINDRQTGLRPLRPTTATVVTGTGSVNALGVLSFSGATAIAFDGIFTSEYQHYKIVIQIITASAPASLRARLRLSGVDNSAGVYYQGGLLARANGSSASFNSSGDTGFYILALASGNPLSCEYTFFAPATAQATNISGNGLGVESSQLTSVMVSGQHFTATAYDGFSIFPSVGNITGTIQVFGYND